MTVTLCHRYTPPEDLAKAVQASDLVVSAAGVPGIITRLVQIRHQVTFLSGRSLNLALFWWMLGLPGFAISERTWLLGMFIKKRGRLGFLAKVFKLYSKLHAGCFLGNSSAGRRRTLHCGLLDVQHSQVRTLS